MDANANEKILAKDVMKTEIISVSPETTVKEVNGQGSCASYD